MANLEQSAMSASWHPDEDATPTPADVQAMVETLEGHHGQHAADIADFFSTMHALKGTLAAAGPGRGSPRVCDAGARHARGSINSAGTIIALACLHPMLLPLVNHTCTIYACGQINSFPT
jgi:hypothetical protein